MKAVLDLVALLRATALDAGFYLVETQFVPAHVQVVHAALLGYAGVAINKQNGIRDAFHLGQLEADLLLLVVGYRAYGTFHSVFRSG